MANMNTFTYTDSMMSRFEFRNVGNTFPLERCAANTTSWILLAASPGQKKQSQSHCSLGIFLLTLFPDFLDRLGKTWKHVLKHGHIICIYLFRHFLRVIPTSMQNPMKIGRTNWHLPSHYRSGRRWWPQPPPGKFEVVSTGRVSTKSWKLLSDTSLSGTKWYYLIL